MGFWDSLGKAASAVGNAAADAAKEAAEKKRQLADQYADRSDSELFDLLARATRNKSLVEGTAIRSLLRERGYDAEDISAKIRNRL